VQLPFEGAAPGSHAIQFSITAADADGAGGSVGKVTEKAVFIVPR